MSARRKAKGGAGGTGRPSIKEGFEKNRHTKVGILWDMDFINWNRPEIPGCRLRGKRRPEEEVWREKTAGHDPKGQKSGAAN